VCRTTSLYWESTETGSLPHRVYASATCSSPHRRPFRNARPCCGPVIDYPHQSDLFYDYRTNVDAYPKWQAWMQKTQPRLLVLWGKYDLSFELTEPEAYRRNVPKAQVHVLDAGHFALDTAADEIADLVRGFMSNKW
jgi:pimeloyl-ACP methyl ester carboxylesterase